MKKIISLILSYTLILSPVALAQGEQNYPTTEQPSAPEPGPNPGSEQPSAPDVGTNPEYDKQSQSPGGYDFYAKQILAISTSVIGANIISQCSFGLKVPSIQTFMAGSVVHIISEIAGAKALNENHNKKMDGLKLTKEQMKKKQGGQLQRVSLEQRKKIEEDTRDYLKSRAMWMAAITVIYTAAMGLAIFEETSGHTAGAAAGATTCAGTAAVLAAPCGIGFPGCYAAHFAACTAFSPTGAATAEGNFANPAAIPTGVAACALTAIYTLGCQSYLTAYSAIAWANCLPWTPASGILGKAMVMAITAAYSMGVSNSAASVTKYFNMFLGLLLFLSSSLEKLVMAAYNFPIPRSITFGASAALSTAITAGLFQRKKIAEDNIAVIKNLLDNFEEETEDPDGLGLGSTGSNDGMRPTTNSAHANKALNKLANGKLRKICASRAGNSFEVSETACRRHIILNRPDFNMTDGIQTLNEVGLMANDLANAVSSGDSAKADILAAKIGNQAMKVKQTVKNLQSKLNDEYLKQGKKRVNFDQEIKNRLGSYESILNKEATARGIPKTSIASEAQLGEELANASIQKKSADVEQKVVEIKNGEGDKNLTSFSEGNLDGPSDKAISVGDSAPLSISDRLEKDGLEINTADINKNRQESIFVILSGRYRKSLERILHRKEKPSTSTP